MEPPPHVVQVVVVEPDADVARAVAGLAFETLSPAPTLLVGAASTLHAARALIDRGLQHENARIVVVCAPHLAEGESSFPVIDHASRADADVRVVLLTNGEREELLQAIRLGVDGVVAKPISLPALRSILRYVARVPDRRMVRLRVDGADEVMLREARDALESALDAVEVAEERLRLASATAPRSTREAVEEARRLAAAAHRRVLEAERELSGHEPSAS